MEHLRNQSILITGGTGSFGKELTKRLLQEKTAKVIVFSRDELKQYQLKETLPKDERLRFLLGDIRDEARLVRALQGVNLVVHAAALKQVDTGEYNPIEFVKTNVIGSQNVITAAIQAGVSKVIALSTDKASSPINLYGATKLTADKLFIAANSYSNSPRTEFSVVRYGNVMGSRGSVLPFFLKLANEGKQIPITDKRMTRFWITIEQAVEFVIKSFSIMQGGELYVPKIPSMRIKDLAQIIAPNSEQVEIGIRPGEKLHEEMISFDDSRRTIELADRYVVNPVYAEWGYSQPEGQRVEEGFSYRSDTNSSWVTPDDLRSFINSYLK